jgi:hypothetical protein
MVLYRIIWIFLLLSVVAGCQNPLNLENRTYKKAYYVNALSKLRIFQSFTTMCYEERGQYCTMQDLFRGGGIDEAFYQAWDGHPDPEPLSGYFFSEIERDSRGALLNRRIRTGLCAYPEIPGKTGDLIICALADMTTLDKKFQYMGDEGVVSGSDEWAIYQAMYEDLGSPVKKWPSQSELKTKFQMLHAPTPQKGLQQARDLFDKAHKQ